MMKKFLLPLLFMVSLGEKEFQREIEHAFLKFDANNDGFVTREEMLHAVADDMGTNQVNDEMGRVIDKMVIEFDVDGNGLDFAELYRASGGNSEDL